MHRPGISIALAAGLVAAGAFAQETLLPPEAEDAEPPLPRYQIELIVFAHTDGDPNEEIFDTDVAPPPRPAPPASLDPGSPYLSLAAVERRRNVFGDVPGLPVSPGFGRAPDAPGGPRDTAADGTAPATATTDPLAPGNAPFAADDAAPDDPFEFIDPFGTLEAAAAPAPGDAPPAEVSEPRLRFLRPDEFQLRDADRILNRLGAYRVLVHGGWIQDGLDEADAEPVDIGYLGTTNPRGTVTLYLGRFLHVALDLLYETPPLPAGAEPQGNPGGLLPGSQAPGGLLPGSQAAGGLTTGAQGPGGLPTASPPGFGRRAFGIDPLQEISTGRWYELKTERNAIRSGEIHYIDHPLLGVLVLITPAPEETEVIEDDTAVLAPAA